MIKNTLPPIRELNKQLKNERTKATPYIPNKLGTVMSKKRALDKMVATKWGNAKSTKVY